MLNQEEFQELNNNFNKLINTKHINKIQGDLQKLQHTLKKFLIKEEGELIKQKQREDNLKTYDCLLCCKKGLSKYNYMVHCGSKDHNKKLKVEEVKQKQKEDQIKEEEEDERDRQFIINQIKKDKIIKKQQCKINKCNNIKEGKYLCSTHQTTHQIIKNKDGVKKIIKNPPTTTITQTSFIVKQSNIYIQSHPPPT